MTVRLRRGALVWCLLGAAVAAVPGSAAAQAVLRGVVVDAATGMPLADAEVTLRGGSAPARVLSDAAGTFRFAARDAAGRVAVRRLGYAAVETEVPPSGDLRIALAALPVALDAIVVTAARREQRLADAVVATELINAQDIVRSGAADAAQVLAAQTGMQIDGGVPAGAGVQLQGLGAQRVLVLLDGQPLAGRVNGNLDLSRIPAAIIERIEVVKGPQSTLYGSDALGGVVNIVTRQPAPGAVRLHAGTVAGSHGRREAAGGVMVGRGVLGAAFEAGYRTTDLAPGVGGTAGTLARRWHAAPRLSWRAGERWTFETGGLVVGERQRYRTGQLYNFADNLQVNWRAGAEWRRGAARFAPVVSWSHFDHLSRRATTATPQSDSGAVDAQNLIQAELPVSLRLGGAWVDAGLALRRDAIRADRVPGGTRVLHTAEPYAQVTVTRGGVDLTPGARISMSERWGTVITPRIAALWRPAAPLAVRAAIGRGYRAPDFKELYLEFANPSAGYAVRGNPDLAPETATNLSLGVEWVARRWYARAGLFDNRYRQFIETTAQDLSGTFSYDNIARGSTRGVEVDAGVVAGPWRLEGGYAGLRARDATTGSPLLGRPAHAGRLAASWANVAARLGATLQLTGPTPLARNDAGEITDTRGTFARLDLRGAFTLATGLEAVAAVENLFDRSLGADWPGFTGRQMSVGLRWTRE